MDDHRRRHCKTLGLLVVATVAFAGTRGECGTIATSVTVPGISDPWLAGMPTGTLASCCGGNCDTVPSQAPVEVLGLPLVAHDSVTFSASGWVNYVPIPPGYPPDGAPLTVTHGAGAEHGIANVTAPASCLLGLFLDEAQPDLTPAPPSLNFGSSESRDYSLIHPELKQVFFIGDGHTTSGEAQWIIVPPGASRLFLGTMDGCGWYDNWGSFDVTVSRAQELASVTTEYPAAGALHLSVNPNPSASIVTINYGLSSGIAPIIEILGTSGRMIRRFVPRAHPGFVVRSVTWDGVDAAGNPIPPGVYFVRLSTGQETLTKKLVMIQ